MTPFVLMRGSPLVSSVPSALKLWRICSRSSWSSRSPSRLNVCLLRRKPQEVNQLRARPLHTISAIFRNQPSAGAAVYTKDARLGDDYRGLGEEEEQKSLDNDTIAAIVTAMGGQQGAVAIVRLSGASAVEIVGRMFQPGRRVRDGNLSPPCSEWTPESHRVQYGNLVDSAGVLVDEVLVVPMLAPRSYTREDVVELQCHGGDVCVRRVLQLCLEAGARLAQPGEFTLRAFLNGRLDLAQAESVAQLVAAKTSVAAQSALAGIQGGLSSFVQSLRMECIDLLVEMEARLDFDDEMPDLDTNALITRIETMCQRLQEALATAGRGRLLQSGLQVAIVGRPNVGKSSLLNAWSQSERAIVTDVPGTTRDIVEARMVVGGIAVNLLDTAGIRDTADIVEKIGVERSESVAKAADVVVMVISASDGWTSADAIIYDRIWGTEGILRQRTDPTGGVLAGPMAPPSESASVINEYKGVQTPSLLVVNKVDRAAAGSVVLPEDVQNAFFKRVATCATQSVGLQELDMAILDLVGLGHVSSEGQQWAVNQRQAEQLVRANEALQRVVESVQMEIPLDMWTIDLKEAAIALGEISGDDVSEEVLSNIFNRFCIGK
ncbi:hypothetical protein M758_4G089900 [Ceratodon purpureus]|nr:hypothetical protein M758_4G089900 [Ceratodon purpureus]